MKYILIILFLLPLSSYSQKVFSVKYSNQSDVKVFVVEYENQCDLKVFKVDYSNKLMVTKGCGIPLIIKTNLIRRYTLLIILTKVI